MSTRTPPPSKTKKQTAARHTKKHPLRTHFNNSQQTIGLYIWGRKESGPPPAGPLRGATGVVSFPTVTQLTLYRNLLVEKDTPLTAEICLVGGGGSGRLLTIIIAQWGRIIFGRWRRQKGTTTYGANCSNNNDCQGNRTMRRPKGG